MSQEFVFGLLFGRRVIVNLGRFFRKELQEKGFIEFKDLNIDFLNNFYVYIFFEKYVLGEIVVINYFDFLLRSFF